MSEPTAAATTADLKRDDPNLGDRAPAPSEHTRRAQLRRRLGQAERPMLLGLTVLGLLLRFVPRGPLWLDEALSVNIADGKLADIPRHLKVDGHPPLYYALLHMWTIIGGESDWWVRCLSGVIAIGGAPLAYLLGRAIARRVRPNAGWAERAGLYTMVLYAGLPFAVRYGSEARMYSLVMVLVLAGALLVDRLVDRPNWGTAVGLAAIVGAGLWTHYWFMWLVAAAGICAAALWMWGPKDRRPAMVQIMAAVFVGCATFLPWLPTLAFQSSHTGTPWGDRFRPATMLVVSLVDFAGGTFAESQFASFALAFLLVVAVATSLRSRHSSSEVALAFPGRTDLHAGHAVAVVIAATMAIGWAASYSSGSTFASRYAAVIFPLVAVLLALGLASLPWKLRAVVGAVVLIGSGAGIYHEVAIARTQAGVAADAIAGHAPADSILVTCPDQLAVSLSRALHDRYQVVVFPNVNRDPHFVDWTDYANRNAAASPRAFVDDVLRKAGRRPIILAVNFTYRTLDTKCAEVSALLQSARTTTPLVAGDGEKYYESMSVFRLDAK